MKLVYANVEHILKFGEGYVCELVVESKRLFHEMVNNLFNQIDGVRGNFVLSVADRPVEFSKYADITLQFAPFDLNRKTLLTKLCHALEQKSLQAENYPRTVELLGSLESFMFHLADDLPFDISCQKVSISNVIRALSPEVDVGDKDTLEQIFAYMELVRELDRDRLFIMINMRTYFADDDMQRFIESVCLHDFKVLLLEGSEFPTLKNTKRYIVDSDLCEL